MRRGLGSVICVCAALTACSSGGGEPSATDPPDTEASPTETAAPSSEDDAAPVPDDVSAGRVELPGLLDSSDEQIPNDDSVRTGLLDNGLRYYVRSNDNPGGKAELRLVIGAGSVDEFGPSSGVAHFVEHMLFNGTDKFPENKLIDVLRSFGAAFGADINAYTTFDETVYSLSVPNADESLQTGLSVLEQWLSHVTFDPDQVVAERGVVLDEWRIRTQSTTGRLFDVAEQMYLRGSAYAGRSPIGTEDSISGMTDTELREFYDTWYRPDNAAIVVVGDVDVDRVEADVQRLFGPAVPRTEDARARESVEFPTETEPDFGLHADPDQLTVDVEVTLPLPSFQGNGTAAWRADLIDLIVYDALVRRLDRDISAGTAPFDRIGPGTNSFVPSLDAPALYSSTDAARAGETLQALLDEYERANRFGFTDDEIELAKSSLRAGYESLYAGRDSTQDVDYADEYVDNFLTGSPFPAITDEYDISLGILDAITADAVDLRFRARWTNTAPHVIISTPAESADQMPSGDEVLSMIAGTASRDLTPRDGQRDLPDELMDRPESVAPISIDDVLSRGDVYLDPIEIVYPNGVRVILNSNTIVEGQVYFQASSPGGSSLVADDDVVDALYAADIVTTGGVADFNQAELDQVLAGRDLAVDAWITPYLENFAGSAATADIEALLQLLHLYMAEPRFDPVALGQLQNQLGPTIDDPASSPEAMGNDVLLDARYPGELRYAVLPTPDEFDTLDLGGVERVWTERYGNASDWVFVFSGDIDIDAVTDLTGSYLGTLPGTEPEQWIDVGGAPPDEVVRASAEAGTGDTASLTLLFTSAIGDVDARLRVNADIATEVIDARLTDVIRERDGESYSPFAVSYITTDPDPVIETYVSVTGSPDRIEAVADLVSAELADLGENGPSDQEFTNAFAQVEESYNFVNNGDFITELLDDAIHPALDLDDYLLEYSELGSVTAASVAAYLTDHVPTGRYIEVIVRPR
jgi:zinc protease